MYGSGALGETALGETLAAGAVIIPEVAVETKTLVFVVELDLLSPGSGEQLEGFDDGTFWSGGFGFTP